MPGEWPPYGLPPEELAGLIETLDSSLYSRPMPAVLDTDCTRTGLHYQLANGVPPASVRAARDGMIRLFMEYAPSPEPTPGLPRSARQFRVPEAELRRMLDEDWLPHV